MEMLVSNLLPLLELNSENKYDESLKEKNLSAQPWHRLSLIKVYFCYCPQRNSRLMDMEVRQEVRNLSYQIHLQPRFIWLKLC